ncbi:MAG: hypothetical protein ACOYD4_11800 [Solirubrobacterales bacterium]
MTDDDQLNLDLAGQHGSPLMRRLAAMAAPIATDAGAVIDDEKLLDVARAVCDAFSHDDAFGGLTKAEIAARVNGVCPANVLEARLGVFARMELLRPVLDKKHQQRYVLAPAGLVGVLIVDRFSARGGIEELLSLLDRNTSALERHEAEAPAVAAQLESCRAMFAVFANELSRLVATAPLNEPLIERRFHDPRRVRRATMPRGSPSGPPTTAGPERAARGLPARGTHRGPGTGGRRRSRRRPASSVPAVAILADQRGPVGLRRTVLEGLPGLGQADHLRLFLDHDDPRPRNLGFRQGVHLAVQLLTRRHTSILSAVVAAAYRSSPRSRAWSARRSS